MFRPDGESMKKISDYRQIVGDAVIGELYQKAKSLYGKRILHINSTFIGGGVAGISAALDLAEQGIQTILVEKEPTIGGVMAQLNKTFPTMDCSI